MKKAILSLIGVHLVFLALFAIWGYAMIGAAYHKEFETVQRLTGAVVTAYPEAETTVMSSLGSDDEAAGKVGAEVMTRYGYDSNDQMADNPVYRKMLENYNLLLGVFFATVCACGSGVIYWHEKKKKNQEQQLIFLLDRCLSGEFSFLEDENALGKLENPIFADTVRKLAANLQLKTDRLNEERDATKSLVTDISHQLKTPISALQSCFYMYMEAEDPKEKEEFLTRCRLQMDKLESLAASLIHISRLEHQMITLRPETVSLTDILISAVNSIYHKAEAREIAILTEEFPDEKLVLDAGWVVEAIANILDNAVKYSPPRSEIEIRVQKLYSFLRIEIEDRGIGIPKEEKNKIFQRFYRGNHEMVKRWDGSGVGLYLSRKIIEDSGGSLSVYDGKKEGSIFVVQLPL